MKILTIHADYIEYEAKKKAIKDAEADIKEGKKRVDECLVVYTTVEKRDEADKNRIVQLYTDNVKDIAQQVKTNVVVLYPYAHLSSSLSNPKFAEDVMKEAEKVLQKEKYEVYRAPFGWYKSFNIACKGHPLSELSREFSVEQQKGISGGEDAKFECSKETMDSSKRIKLSASFLLAEAIKNLYPKVEVGSFGIYQDQSYVDILGVKFSKDDLPKLEKEFMKTAQQNLEFKSSKSVNGELQKEILKDVKDAEIYSLKNLNIAVLYKKPFVKSSKEIAAFKITNLSSVYWKNNAKNKSLTRIYSVAFASKKEFDSYLARQEELERRDHRKIGEELDLFTFHETSPGMPYWLPKGLILYQELVKFWKEEHDKLDYQELSAPLVNKKELWEISGHWEHYRKDMFISYMGEGEIYGLKAMNCPNAMIVFSRKPRSYRELPLKLSDTDKLHRYELSGTLNGLLRVRSFSQDDAHIYVSLDQIEQQYEEILGIADKFYRIFGLDYKLRLGTRPEKFMGDKETWDFAESVLKKILEKGKKKFGREYFILEGDGAFYGPKIDIVMKDSLGRDWQTGTVQLDFQQPRRFNLKYVDKDGKEQTPVVVHRVVYGSLERFIGILTEHFAGAFPLWINPVQVKVITVNDKCGSYAEKIVEELKLNRIRVEYDDRRDTVEKKVRDAMLEKVNYIATVGDKEVQEKKIAVKSREGAVKFDVALKDFIAQLKKEIESKKF